LKISNHKLCQFIVKKFIKDKINWAREIKIAQNLTKIYKGYNFWNNLNDLKLPSLAWFLTEDGKRFLATEDKKKYLDIKRVKEAPLMENKIGEDKKICKKPKTLIEFITYGKKI
jgi:hypothetical protein